jgi:endonuclease YncB( thermonuclease family)
VIGNATILVYLKKNLKWLFGDKMKKLLVVLLLAPALVLAQKTPQGVIYDAKIVRVNDGDTVVIAAPFLPAPLKPELAVRVFGVDTPEKGFRAQCPQEDQRGQAATAFTKNAVATTQKHQVVLYGWDKFGGRVLGDLILNGVSLRAELIRNGFAREYYGEAKQSWCN